MTSTNERNNAVPRLCSVCRAVDFGGLLPSTSVVTGHRRFNANGTWSNTDVERKRTHFWDRDIGTLENLLSRSDSCDFCCFLIDLIGKHNDRDLRAMHNRVEQQLLHGYLTTKTIGFFHVLDNTEGWIQLHDYVLQRIGIRINLVGTNHWDTRLVKGVTPDVLHLPYAIRVGYKQTTMLSEDKKNPLVGRYRSARCDGSLFGSWLDRCQNEHRECNFSGRSGLTGTLRLIDVEPQCLRTFPSHSDVFSPYLALSYVWGNGLSNYVLTSANLENLHLPDGLKVLPKTISDAMQVVRMFGMRYLWVDSSCIIRDDPHDKSSQIPQMATIYENAILTIVAAFGDSAQSGLPGISADRSEDVILDLGELAAFGSTATVDAYYGHPVLSTVWSTRGWTFQEWSLSRRRLIFLDGLVCWSCRSKDWTEDLELENQEGRLLWGHNVSETRGSTELTVSNYSELIKQYTRRQLTYDNDILNAFAGILSAIPDEFLWGIPLSQFGEHLCWYLQKETGGGVRVSAVATWRNLEAAPSWSWAAWKGRITINYKKRDSRVLCSVITCFRLQGNALNRIYNATETFQQYTAECTVNEIPTSVKIEDSYVIFWASYARLKVVQTKSPSYQNYDLYSGAECLGGIWLDTEYPLEEDSLYDFAVLARYGDKELVILMLSWEDNIARRKTLGNFDKNAWHRANPTLKLIILG